jgi:hypothetical protein
MCEEEYQNTLKYGVADFSKQRFKWFSPHLYWIQLRVRDGSFNNSRHCPDRYKYLLQFEVDESLVEVKRYEVQVDRRKNLKIKLIKEIK